MKNPNKPTTERPGQNPQQTKPGQTQPGKKQQQTDFTRRDTQQGGRGREGN